jgi:hypothetical protein
MKNILDFIKSIFGFVNEIKGGVKPVPEKPIPTPTPVDPSVEPTPTPPVQDDFAGIKFRNSADCSKWKVTANISDVSVRGGNIYWKEDGIRDSTWNRKGAGKIVNGESILIIPSRGEAGMFDFLRVGQRSKILSNLKVSDEGPGFFPGWIPVKGEKVGFLIATMSRDKSAAKMQERSNVVWFQWPRDGV